MNLSFIIPTYNEQAGIVDVVTSIQTTMQSVPLTYEIIIVDDASTDNTLDLARSTGVTVLSLSTKRYVSYVRNIGAKESATGEILVFLDGDVLLTPEWGDEIVERYDLIISTKIVTGSTVGIPPNSPRLVTAWFGPILSKQRKYINTGHLIVSSSLFKSLNGFNEDLETGEDTDFSERARKLGSSIINNSKLYVIHLGYPSTFLSFFKRERWHGKGNFSSSKKILSKVSLTVLSMWIFFLAGIALFPATNLVLIGSIIYFLSWSVLFGFQRCKSFSSDLLICTLLSMTFFTARGVSLLDVLIEKR